MDVARAEMVESELDAMIRRRDTQRRETEGDRAAEELYAESVRRYNDRQHQQHRAEWYAYHMDQAQRVEGTAAGIAAEHRRKAAELLDGGAGAA